MGGQTVDKYSVVDKYTVVWRPVNMLLIGAPKWHVYMSPPVFCSFSLRLPVFLTFPSFWMRLLCCLFFLSLMFHGSHQLYSVLHPISFTPKVWFVAQDGPQLCRLALCGGRGLEPQSWAQASVATLIPPPPTLPLSTPHPRLIFSPNFPAS